MGVGERETGEEAEIVGRYGDLLTRGQDGAEGVEEGAAEPDGDERGRL